MIIMKYKDNLIQINDDDTIIADAIFRIPIRLILHKLGPQDGERHSAVFARMQASLPELQLVELRVPPKPDVGEDDIVMY